MGEYILSDHAAPAVILYNSTLVAQAFGWTLVTGSALRDQLAKNENVKHTIRQSRKFSYFAFILYALCAIMAIWFPFPVAIITTITWIFWLIWGVSIRHE